MIATYLKAISDLLADPARWTQRADARTADGSPVGWDHPDAARWCIFGALHRCVPQEDRLAVLTALHNELPADRALTHVNDGPDGHARILDLLNRAQEVAA